MRLLMLLPWLASACHRSTGPESQPLPAVGHVTSGRFHSTALGTDKPYLLYLPPSYATDPRRRFPVVYLLHGLTGNESDWASDGRLPKIADSLAAAGVPEVIYVMPDGDNGFWSDWASSLGLGRCAEDPAMSERPTTFCVPQAHYGTYAARDLVTEIDISYRTIADRAHRGVAGVSMGGIGALTLGLTFPDRFVAVVSLSAPASPLLGEGWSADTLGSLASWEAARGGPLNAPWRSRWGADTAMWWRQDPARAAARLVGRGQHAPALWIVVGDQDPYRTANRHLDVVLTRLGVAHQYQEASGAHAWSFWHRAAPPALAWLARQLSP